MKIDLQGIIPATFTPMHENGEINLNVIDDYVELLEKRNINNAFLLGSAGEGCSLSIEERKRVAERWMKSAKNRVKNIIVHVGTCNLVDTKTLAAHAESIGATAVAVLPPFYFKPSTPKHLALCLVEIAKSAPKTPLLFYHMPSATGVNLKVKEVMDEVEKIGIPNFAGIKYTGHDLCDFGQCVDQYGEKYSIFYGYDEQVSSGLFMGAQSCVGSTYNYALKLYQKLHEACMRGDVKTALKEQFKVQRVISYLFTVGLDIGMGKALMFSTTGINVGPPRLPMLATPKEKVDEILKRLKGIGFFEWIE